MEQERDSDNPMCGLHNQNMPEKILFLNYWNLSVHIKKTG